MNSKRRRPIDCPSLARDWRRDAGRVAVTLCLCVQLAASAAVRADEVIEVDDQGNERRRTGEILDYRGDGLVLRPLGGPDRQIAAARVARVDADWLPEHRRADALFAVGDYAAALEPYREAFQQEGRSWVRRRILARLVECQRNTGRLVPACRNFARLWMEDKDTPYFDSIPLTWLNRQPPNDLQQFLQSWRGGENDLVQRLMAASWLLSSSQRVAANDAMRQLARVPRTEIAKLAKAQLWRTRLAQVTAAEVERWAADIEQLPRSLRAGPYFVLGEGLARTGDADQAALAYLRVPTLYAADRGLGQAALLAAAGVLFGAEQREEALRLYQQAVELDPESLDGRQARDRLAELEGGTL